MRIMYEDDQNQMHSAHQVDKQINFYAVSEFHAGADGIKPQIRFHGKGFKQQASSKVRFALKLKQNKPKQVSLIEGLTYSTNVRQKLVFDTLSIRLFFLSCSKFIVKMSRCASGSLLSKDA